jgi:excisionase family DNA binding protein
VDESGTRRVTVEEAAQLLGIKEESVRKRVSRGTLRADKDPDGRLLVYVDTSGTVRDEYADQSVTERDELLASKDRIISILENQLEAEREARRRADTIIAQLTQANAALAARVPELEAAQEPSEHAEEPAEGEAGVQDQPSRREEPRSSEKPWWRRMFGG